MTLLSPVHVLILMLCVLGIGVAVAAVVSIFGTHRAMRENTDLLRQILRRMEGQDRRQE